MFDEKDVNYKYLPQKHEKLETILNGFEINNEDFIPLNTTLTLTVKKFISNSKRFS